MKKHIKFLEDTQDPFDEIPFYIRASDKESLEKQLDSFSKNTFFVSIGFFLSSLLYFLAGL